MAPPADLPDDSAACHRIIRELWEQLQAQQRMIELERQLPEEQARLVLMAEQQAELSEQQAETIGQQQKRIEHLQHEIELLKRYIYGPRRERFVDPRQAKLFEVDGEEPEHEPADPPQEDPPAPKRRRGHGRRPLPEHLRRKTVVYELDEEELPCPCCGQPRCKVSEQISEQLEFIPAVLHVLRHVRYVYACQNDDCQGNMQTAAKPPQPIEKGLPGPGLLGYLVTSKLADHLPLYRLEDIFSRQGLQIPRSTQCDWMAAAARLARPLYERMVHWTLQSHVVASDDTTVPYLDPTRDRAATGYFWSYLGDSGHPHVCYDFTLVRNRDGPEAFLGGFAGILQGDAFSGYIELAKDSGGQIVHAGCWAHARRYFDKAREKSPQRTVHEALAFIQRLYDVEHQVDERAAANGWDAERIVGDARREVAADPGPVPRLVETATRHGASQQPLGRSGDVLPEPMGVASGLHWRRRRSHRQQRLRAGPSSAGVRSQELDPAGQPERRSDGGRAVQPGGQLQAAEDRSASVSDGCLQALAFDRGRGPPAPRRLASQSLDRGPPRAPLEAPPERIPAGGPAQAGPSRSTSPPCRSHRQISDPCGDC